MNKIRETKERYGYIWGKINSALLADSWHFNDMQELIIEPIVRGEKGIDIGSGCGYDTYIMAKKNPSVRIASLDISDGIYKAGEFTSGLKNAWIIKGSALEIPIKDNTFDFAYSFGVLHHTPDPERGIKETARIIKKGAPVFLYLYEDHSDNIIKYLAIKIITFIRKITTRIPPKMMYVISCLASPFVVLLFTYPSKIFKKFKATQNLANKMPFNFGTHPFSVADDLYDRFSAPIEYRFSKKEIFDLLSKNGFVDIQIEKFKDKAGWVSWGKKS